ncbi:unnamed protein product [Caenorhabditis nigoni]
MLVTPAQNSVPKGPTEKVAPINVIVVITPYVMRFPGNASANRDILDRTAKVVVYKEGLVRIATNCALVRMEECVIHRVALVYARQGILGPSVKLLVSRIDLDRLVSNLVHPGNMDSIAHSIVSVTDRLVVILFRVVAIARQGDTVADVNSPVPTASMDGTALNHAPVRMVLIVMVQTGGVFVLLVSKETNASRNCDTTNGKCICPVGRHGPLCEEECRAGRYGESCMNKCQCFNGASCDPKTGQCTCSPGWLGPTCQVEMLDPNNIANRGDLPEDWEWRKKR